jgi:class 3 adenylate cyclase
MPATSTASFLFCDLVGSTALLTRIGDDASDDVRRRCFGTFREAAAEHHGVEVKTMGDGMLVLFSNSVGDAIGSAIAMQRGVARLDHESPLLGLRLRVGVAVGEAGHEEGDWFGTPVIEAARLCAAARSGQILVTDLACRLVGRRGAYRFSSLGAMELKGLEPTLVSEVAWEPEPGQSVVPLPAALERRGHLVFVGRQKERAVLDAAWRRAEGGRLGAVVLTGEQGIGKPALVAEVARAIQAKGGTVLYGRCRLDVAEPYEAFAEALAWYVATAPASDLRVHLGPLGGELVRIVPSLLTRFADLPRPEVEPSGARRRLFDAVEGLLTQAAAASPMLLVLPPSAGRRPAAGAGHSCRVHGGERRRSAGDVLERLSLPDPGRRHRCAQSARRCEPPRRIAEQLPDSRARPVVRDRHPTARCQTAREARDPEDLGSGDQSRGRRRTER